MSTTSLKEREVKDWWGRWRMLDTRPYIYVTARHEVEGAVITLVDIHEAKSEATGAEEELVKATRASA